MVLRDGFHKSFSQIMVFRIRELSGFDETLQNFIYKHIVNLENVQMNKKKEKGEFTRCQVSSN